MQSLRGREFLGREEGDATVWTKQERKEAEPGASSSTPSTLSEREDRANPGGLAEHLKATVKDTYGSPDVPESTEVEKPTPKDDEVLLKVHAASVKPADWHLLRGMPYIARLQLGLRKPILTCLVVDQAALHGLLRKVRDPGMPLISAIRVKPPPR